MEVITNNIASTKQHNVPWSAMLVIQAENNTRSGVYGVEVPGREKFGVC